HLHHQVVRAHALDHLPAGVVLGATILVVHAHVVACGAPHDRLGRRRLRAGGFAANRAPRAATTALLRGDVTHRGDPAEVAAALSLDQDRLADAQRRLGVRPDEIRLPRALEADLDRLAHPASV